MAIKGIGEKVTELQKGNKAIKTERKVKQKATFYLEVELANLLRSYAFQERKTISASLEDLIKDHVKGKVRKEFLRT